MSPTSPEPDAAPTPPSYSLWQLVRYMLGLGTWGIGGPVALLGYMYRDLVEKRKWIAEGDYKEGLALAQLMPRPLAAQLAIYLGYVHYRVRGATLRADRPCRPPLDGPHLKPEGFPWTSSHDRSLFPRDSSTDCPSA